MNINNIKKSFALYGFMLTDQNLIADARDFDYKVTALRLASKGKRIQVRGKDDNRLVWSGIDPVNFLTSFWFAEKI